MTLQDHRADRVAELEKELRDAHLALACLIYAVGGTVTVPQDLLVRAERCKPLMQVDTSPNGNVTYTVEAVL